METSLAPGVWPLAKLPLNILLVVSSAPTGADIYITSQPVESFFPFQILPVFSSHSIVAHEERTKLTLAKLKAPRLQGTGAEQDSGHRFD